MEQQKAFSTAFMGFDKKAVLDYIYEQDMLFKKKEAEWDILRTEIEEKLEASEQNASNADEYQQQVDALTASCNEEKANTAAVQLRYDKLSEEIDQLIQVAKNKERELQLQVELNNQMKYKCDMLESKLKVLANHLIAEREQSAALPEVIAVNEDSEEVQETIVTEAVTTPATEEKPDEYVDLKEELEDFRSSVSKTLLNFEAALARLETGKPENEAASENRIFFH